MEQMEVIKKCKMADSLGSCTRNVARSQNLVGKEITVLWAVCWNCLVSCFPKARPQLCYIYVLASVFLARGS